MVGWEVALGGAGLYLRGLLLCAFPQMTSTMAIAN